MKQNVPSEPIRYVERLADYYGSLGHPAYQWTVNNTAPWKSLDKPLGECRVTMLTSGGVSLCGRPGFEPMARNDHRLDAIPEDSSTSDFRIHDAYYDHADADQDLNCQFPIDRLRELVKTGELGSLAPRLWSGFMGRIYNRSKVLNDSGPEFVAELRGDEVDLLIAVPA